MKNKEEQADRESILKPSTPAWPTEWQATAKALEQSLTRAHREIAVLEKLREGSRVRDAQAEVFITATLAKSVALEGEKIAVLAELGELRDQLASLEAARATEVTALVGELVAAETFGKSEQAKVTELQNEKSNLATEITKLRDKLAAAESVNTVSQANVTELKKEKYTLENEVSSLRRQLAASEVLSTRLQKEKTTLLGQSTTLRQELAKFERKLNALHKSFSWRITRPIRSVKIPSMWKKKR